MERIPPVNRSRSIAYYIAKYELAIAEYTETAGGPQALFWSVRCVARNICSFPMPGPTTPPQLWLLEHCSSSAMPAQNTSSTTSTKLDSTDHKFVTEAAEGGIAEVGLGKPPLS